MKSLFTAVWVICSLLSVGVAHAKDVPLIEISGDGCKVRIPLGVRVSDADSRRLEGIYYKDEDADAPTFFSAESMSKMTLVYSYKGYDAAFLQLAPWGNHWILSIKYLGNGIKHSYHTIQMYLVYNVHTGRYDAVDPKTNRAVTQAYVVPNKVFMVGMVGISELRLR